MTHYLAGALTAFLLLSSIVHTAGARTPASDEIKALIDGTWCTDEKGSYIQREGLESPTLIKKREICHTFKVTHAGDDGGVGRMYESYYHADLKDLKISREVLDDPEAVHHVMKIACDFRQRFKRDVVIDLVCYRKHGHNEADEPAATQPMMYKTIRGMKTTRQKYAEDLVSRGIIETDYADKLMDQYRQRLDDGEQVADVESHPRTNEHAANWHSFEHGSEFGESDVKTGMAIADIIALAEL